METLLYVNNNGKIIENNGPVIHAGNRGFLYGDGLFESIRVKDGKPINLSVHITRLFDGMRVLKMRIPAFFTVDFFEEKISEILKKSSLQQGGKVRLSIDRAIGGTYKPTTNEVSFFIEAYPYKYNEFVLNEKGLEIDLYTKIRKEKTPYANFKVKNALLNVLAAIEGQEKKVDDMLLTGCSGEIVEAVSSNVFIVSNGILYTPSLEDNCVGGTMRMTLINIALENKIRVYESPITPQNLLVADEIILTNAIQGIQWVGGYRTKRYMNHTAVKLMKLLNAYFM